MARNVRGTYRKPWSKMAKLDLTKEQMSDLGTCMVEIFAREAKKDFVKRGWSMRDPMGGPPIGESFGFRLPSKNVLAITSSFYGIPELSKDGIPSRRMTWLTQEAKDKNPSRYKLTEGEKKRGMRRVGKVSKGERLSLIVPIQESSGNIVFRMAPLKLANAWVHPGIAKFTFVQRAMKKSREECKKQLMQMAKKAIIEGTS